MIAKGKKRVQITMTEEKYKELKHLAIDNKTTISDLLLNISDLLLTMKGR